MAAIEQATGGKLAVQAHPNGTLLAMPQIRRGVQTGQVQLGEILLSTYGNEDPFFEVGSVPSLADTAEAAGADAANATDAGVMRPRNAIFAHSRAPAAPDTALRAWRWWRKSAAMACRSRQICRRCRRSSAGSARGGRRSGWRAGNDGGQMLER